MEGIDVPQLISAIASVGVAVWATYFMLSHMIPKLLERHEAERDKTMTRFENSLDKIVSSAEASNLRLTKHCEEELSRIVAAMSK